MTAAGPGPTQQRQLWCVATEDAGDGGPFRSVIYRVATVDPDSADLVQLIANPTAEWVCEGVKVEALGAPLTDAEGLTIGTDDEDYPGMFRPLFPVPSSTPHIVTANLAG